MPAVLLYPTWEISHSRAWKLQISYLARHCRVVTFDRRGHGRSDRPDERLGGIKIGHRELLDWTDQWISR